MEDRASVQVVDPEMTSAGRPFNESISEQRMNPPEILLDSKFHRARQSRCPYRSPTCFVRFLE